MRSPAEAAGPRRDAGWDESLHPRDEGGKFGSGGGGSGDGGPRGQRSGGGHTGATGAAFEALVKEHGLMRALELAGDDSAKREPGARSREAGGDRQLSPKERALLKAMAATPKLSDKSITRKLGITQNQALRLGNSAREKLGLSPQDDLRATARDMKKAGELDPKPRRAARAAEAPKPGDAVIDEGAAAKLVTAGAGEHPDIGAEKRVAVKSPRGKSIAKFVGEGGDTRYVISVKGEPVAALHVKSSDGKQATIEGVYTNPDFRRQGLAARLLKVAEADFDAVKHAGEGALTKEGRAWRNAQRGARAKPEPAPRSKPAAKAKPKARPKAKPRARRRDWEESLHPRAPDGKFGEGSGGSAPAAPRAPSPKSTAGPNRPRAQQRVARAASLIERAAGRVTDLEGALAKSSSDREAAIPAAKAALKEARARTAAARRNPSRENVRAAKRATRDAESARRKVADHDEAIEKHTGALAKARTAHALATEAHKEAVRVATAPERKAIRSIAVSPRGIGYARVLGEADTGAIPLAETPSFTLAPHMARIGGEGDHPTVERPREERPKPAPKPETLLERLSRTRPQRQAPSPPQPRTGPDTDEWLAAKQQAERRIQAQRDRERVAERRRGGLAAIPGAAAVTLPEPHEFEGVPAARVVSLPSARAASRKRGRR